jgi:hypothetical protein
MNLPPGSDFAVFLSDTESQRSDAAAISVPRGAGRRSAPVGPGLVHQACVKTHRRFMTGKMPDLTPRRADRHPRTFAGVIGSCSGSEPILFENRPGAGDTDIRAGSVHRLPDKYDGHVTKGRSTLSH